LPKCGYQFPPHVPELVHFDCPQCAAGSMILCNPASPMLGFHAAELKRC
jgi:hypothetical protein